MYELCACGIPSVCFSWADNQLMAVKSFSEKGFVPCAGDMREDEVTCIGGIIECLYELLEDKKLRGERSRLMRRVADGMGVWNFVAAVGESHRVNTPIQL